MSAHVVLIFGTLSLAWALAPGGAAPLRAPTSAASAVRTSQIVLGRKGRPQAPGGGMMPQQSAQQQASAIAPLKYPLTQHPPHCWEWRWQIRRRHHAPHARVCEERAVLPTRTQVVRLRVAQPASCRPSWLKRTSAATARKLLVHVWPRVCER